MCVSFSLKFSVFVFELKFFNYEGNSTVFTVNLNIWRIPETQAHIKEIISQKLSEYENIKRTFKVRHKAQQT